MGRATFDALKVTDFEGFKDASGDLIVAKVARRLFDAIRQVTSETNLWPASRGFREPGEEVEIGMKTSGMRPARSESSGADAY